MKHKFMTKICSIGLCISLLAMTASAFSFEEIAAEDIFSPETIESEKVSDWAKSEIDLAREAGLLTEQTDSHFTANITRGAFAEIIVNLAEKVLGEEITPAPNTTFTDTTDTAILKAYAAGIVSGVGEGKFEPETTTNREQIATMIYRAVVYMETQSGAEFTEKTTTLTGYTDSASVSDWATEGVAVLANNGIMKGTSDTTLAPQASCTIEQSIILVYRLFLQQ